MVVNLINFKDIDKDTKKQIIIKIVRPINNILNAMCALGFYAEIFSKKITYLLGTITTITWWTFFVILK